MALLVQNINAVAEWFSEVPGLLRDATLLNFTVFTKFSVPESVSTFKLMINTGRFIQLKNYGDSHYNKKCLERVKKLTLLVSNYFQYLNFP